MATDLTGLIATLSIGLTAKAQKAVDLSTPQSELGMTKALATLFGTGLGKSNQIAFDRRVLAGAASESLDFAAGTFVNPFGATVTFANVKAIVIFNRSDETLTHADGSHTATDADMSIGNTAANEFVGPFHTAADGVKLEAGGMFVITNPLAAGWTVTADSGDLIDIKNEDATDELCYDIAVIGEAA